MIHEGQDWKESRHSHCFTPAGLITPSSGVKGLNLLSGFSSLGHHTVDLCLILTLIYPHPGGGAWLIEIVCPNYPEVFQSIYFTAPNRKRADVALSNASWLWHHHLVPSNPRKGSELWEAAGLPPASPGALRRNFKRETKTLFGKKFEHKWFQKNPGNNFTSQQSETALL